MLASLRFKRRAGTRRSNSAIEPSQSHPLPTNPNNLLSVSLSKFFQNNKTKMEIESPISGPKLEFQKISMSAGQTKKRKLSNLNLKLNSDGASKKYDPYFDCFTPMLEESAKDVTLAAFCKSKKLQDEYLIQEHLGKKRQKQVLKCQNKLDQILYAVKILPIDGFPVSQARETILNCMEMEKTGLFEQYFFCWKEEQDFILVFEFLQVSLAGLIKDENFFSEGQIRWILKDIGLALTHLHKKKKTHLNVKPGNIFLNTHGKNFKLGDLGLKGKSFDERYGAGELFQSSEVQEVDLKKCDIFSLGMVLLELMTKKEPPKKIHYSDWIRLRKLQNTKFLDKYCHFSISLKEIISRMLSPEPSNRPNAEEILQLNYENAFVLSSELLRDEILEEERKISELKRKMSGKPKRKTSFS